MKSGDYVLIPYPRSKQYALGKIIGEYEYNENEELCHSRKIEIMEDKIPREIFSQSLQYSMGAFRTLFKIKNEEEVFETINDWRNKKW